MIKIKKNILLTASLSALLASSSLAFANNTGNPPPTADNGGRVVTAIQELGNKIESLAKASVKSINTIAYQLDKSLSASVLLNTQQESIQNRTRDNVQKDTDRAIKIALQPFSDSTVTYTNSSQPEVRKIQAESKARENYINQLKNLEASDSIYSLVQGIEVSSFWTRKNLGNPQRNDDAFNFAALIGPDAYTAEQIKNSQNFIGFATKQYQPFTDGLNLSQLRSALTTYQRQGTKTLSQKIDEFRKNDAYKNYQMTIRSMTAARSVSTEILSEIAAERKPILTSNPDTDLAGISRAIGVEPKIIEVTGADGQKISMYQYASPLQIAKYRANYRLNNAQWYQEVASDSIENLQRKSVILLAEISSQLYQNHLDHEKMLGALAMVSLQSGEASSLMLKTQVQAVNTAIANFAGSAATTNANNESASGNSTSDYSDINSDNYKSKIPDNIDTSKY